MINVVRMLKCGSFSDLNGIGLSLNKIVKAKIIVHVFIFIYLSIYRYELAPFRTLC